MTVLFVDLVGSTPLAEAIDPEALRSAMDSFYSACTEAIVKNGGVPEKYIGDAVMAVFGAYLRNGDEAKHAIEAALAIRSSLRNLNSELAKSIGIDLEIRCGIQSGEAVVVGSPFQGEPRIVGDVVNTAARLQSAAGVNEILIGDETAQLVSSRLLVDDVRSITLKGKRDPVDAHSVHGFAPQPNTDDMNLMLGRGAEVAQLQSAWTASQHRRKGQLVLVSGPPGIGKSRLVRGFLAAQATPMQVLRGACQGRGLTYQPIVDFVRCMPHGWTDVVRLLSPAQAGGERAIGALAAALDLTPDTDQIAGVADISWAVRCLITAAARQGPLVVVLEDLHNAELTLLDLIREAIQGVQEAVLVVCTARPEFFLERPDWGSDRNHILHMELGALTKTDTKQLLLALSTHAEPHHRLEHVPLTQIAESCGGNPLYAEFLFLAAHSRNASPGLPATIRVLLEAWLDRLDTVDQEVLRRAATIGPVFSIHQLLALDDDLADQAGSQGLGECLERLLRSGMIQRTSMADHFDFAQSLVRETLYEATAKSRRATWHLSEANRLSQVAQSVAQADLRTDSQLAHHLESAYQMRKEIRSGKHGIAALAERAAQALIRAGSRAIDRKDLPAAIALLERGRDLVPAGDQRHQMLALRISDACVGLGAWQRGERTLVYADDMLPGDGRVNRLTMVLRQTLRTRTGLPPQNIAARMNSDLDDDLSWCRFFHLTALQHFSAGRLGQAEAALSQGLTRAHSLDHELARYEAGRLQVAICELTQWSPTHVRKGIALCTDLLPRIHADRTLLIPVMLTKCRLHAMAGEIREARTVLAGTRKHVDQLRLAMGAAAVEQAAGFIEGLAGEPPTAHEHYQMAVQRLDDLGLSRESAVSRIYAAREALRYGDVESATATVRSQSENELDIRGRLLRSALKARLSAIAAQAAETSVAARQAISALRGTDDPILIGDVWFDLAQAMADLDLPTITQQAAARAQASYRLKGASFLASHVRRWLTSNGWTPS